MLTSRDRLEEDGNTSAGQRRILLTIPTVTSYHTFLRELVQSLVLAGWDAHLACSLRAIEGFDCYPDEVKGTTHHVSFPRGANPVEHFRAAGQLRKLVARLAPNIVHCHFGVTAFTGAIARRSWWPPVIATIQGLTFPQTRGLRRAIFSLCESWSQRSLDGTWVLSECDRQALLRFGDPKRIHVQRSKGFGCRLEDFAPENYDRVTLDALRAKLGIGNSHLTFIFIGRQVHFKGFALVVRAFFKLVSESENVMLILVGDRDPLHPSGLSTMEEGAVRSHPKIRRIGWVNNVADYLAVSDVNVFPSEREGMPVNLMESLAMGVPVITSNSRGCRHIVEHGRTGLVIQNPSPETLARAMRLMKDGVLRQKLSANALAQRSSFDRRHWIEEQIHIYNTILDPDHRTRKEGRFAIPELCSQPPHLDSDAAHAASR